MSMNTPTIILLVVMSLSLIVIPKRLLYYPLIIGACMVPMNQRTEILTLDFTILRILIIVCVLRLLIRRETTQIHWNYFDKLILIWNLVGTFVYVIQWGTLSAFILKCGVMYDCLGTYWIFRQLINSWDDIRDTIKAFALMAIISAPLIAMEKYRETSFYSYFGEVGARFHRGRFRCAGPFPHSIMMGAFWATLLPLFYSVIKTKEKVIFLFFGIISALICVYYSGSSTPFFTVFAVCLLWHLYKFRTYGKLIFAMFLSTIFFLHIIMKAPVWHLISRIDIFGGSTGWHRYRLIDAFINNANDWIFLGIKTTANWGPQLFDITNQFVLEGVRGGLVTLLIFIIILYNAVRIPGICSLNYEENEIKWLSWGICVSLLGHYVTFLGVSYFGQINLLFYMMMAFVGFSQEKIQYYNKVPEIKLPTNQ